MKKISCILAVIAALALLTAAQAANTFTLTNKTGLEIASIQFGPYDTTDQWGPNNLAAPLADGASIQLTFSPHAESDDWDIRVLDSEDNEIIFYLVPLATISKVSLTYNDYVPESDYE